MPESHQGTDGVLSLKDVDPDALKVVRKLLAAGHEAYLVGGCVRDLYLSRRPKDFDVATSATPEAIRRTFRNSRIIGRRFKLAHVYFGPKIIETSTFRAAPKATDDDPLITHDNEWGSVEEDARRRDFTINGLFYDIESEKIVDFVDGMDDLDDRTIRTIGDPEVRFREDPVRMIRAIKFAARLDFEVEPQTWDALLQTVPDISKCSTARLLEELYKLLRGGASRRSFELLLEAGLLQIILPSYHELFGPDGLRPRAEVERDDDGADPNDPSALLYRYLDCLDRYVAQTDENVGNGVLQAVLFAPLLREEMQTASRRVLDRRIDDLMTPVATDIGVARRDRELAKQILMASGHMISHGGGGGGGRRRRSSMVDRQYFHEALVFLGLAVDAQHLEGSELAFWKQLAEAKQAATDRGDDPPPSRPRRRSRRRRGRSGGRGKAKASAN